MRCWGKDSFPGKENSNHLLRAVCTGISSTQYLTSINKTEGGSLLIAYLTAPQSTRVTFSALCISSSFSQDHSRFSSPESLSPPLCSHTEEQRKERTETVPGLQPLNPQPHGPLTMTHLNSTELGNDILAGRIGSPIITGCDCKGKSWRSIW